MKKFILTMLSAVAAVASAFAAELPYSQSFDTSDDFNTLTLWHATSDSRDWDYSSNAARFYPGSRYNTYDAWFFLPALELEGGKQYVISFNTKISTSGSTNYKDLSVNVGIDATPATQSELWRENITSSSYTNKKVAFTPDSDGSYVVGFRTNADSGSMNDILVDDIKVDSYRELPGLATDITAAPGEKGALSVTLTWTNPTVNDGGNALSQLSGVKIYRTNSSWVSISENILIATVTDNIAPGEQSTYEDNGITSSGNYYYFVVPFNDNGACPLTVSSVKTSGYVGPDTGLSATKNVVAAALENNEKAISLTWDAPSGTNGGYVDPSSISWKITRKGPATVVVAENWKGELPYTFVDETITELGAYTYTVQYINNGKTESTGATSNKVVTGGAAALPYSEDFSSSTALDLYSVFNGENSSTTTKWAKPGSYYSYVQLNQSSGTMDAWLVTPPFELKAEAYYDLEFSTSASTSVSKTMEVMVGQEPTADGLTQSVFDETLSLTTTMKANSVRFKADANGRFYIGFHAKGTSGNGYFRLSNIKLSEVIVAPVAATNLTATADPDGAFLVNVAWTNPSVDVLGNELASLTKVEVLRGAEVIETYEIATPGAEMTLTDEVEAPGKYTYSVVAYLGENAGEAATVTSDKVGGALELPYEIVFDSEVKISDWTMPANADGSSYTFDASSSCLVAPDKRDIWLFTPEFKAKKGVVTFTLNGARRSTFSETIKVALYKTAETSAPAQSDIISYTFTSTNNTAAVFEIEVTEAGIYTIGIARPTSGWNLYLYGASIVQTSTLSETMPLAATDLTVTGDDDDDALVHLSWLNPSLMQGGGELTEITKVVVLRDNEVIATLTDDIIPGAISTYDDTVPASGVYTYTIIVYNGEEASDPTTAKSPFIGSGFELPYECVLSSPETIEFWTLPANDKGNCWKYNTDSGNEVRTGLQASSNNVKAFSIPFKAKEGKIAVSYVAASYSSRYIDNLSVALVASAEFDAEPIGESQTQEITNINFREVYTSEFDVPADGKYYICFYLEESKMYLYLSSIKIEQTEQAVENIIVLWDNTDAQFAKPVVEVNGVDYEMTPYVEPTLMVLNDETSGSQTLDTNIHIAEIPGNADSIIFKDGENADAETVAHDNPQHMWIYSSTGSKKFDENEVTGIEDVDSDNNSKVRYFDLGGVEVSNPLSGNVYIIVRGSKASKSLVK